MPIRRFVAAAAGVGEAHDGLCGAERPGTVAAGQAESDVTDDGQQLLAVGFELLACPG